MASPRASLLLTLVLAGCSPEMMMMVDDAGDVAARPRPDAIDPTFDATARDSAAPMDGPAPATCADWCALRLNECGDPIELARDLCNERCARVAMPSPVIACLASTACIDVRTAFSRQASICGLDPVADSGVMDTGADARSDSGVMDTGADVRSDTGVMDTGADVRSDTGADVRSDTGVMDTGADVRSDTGVMDTGADVRSDTGATDTGADVRSDTGADVRG